MSIYIPKQTLDGNSILTANLPLEALLGGPLGLASQSLIEINFITSPTYTCLCVHGPLGLSVLTHVYIKLGVGFCRVLWFPPPIIYGES